MGNMIDKLVEDVARAIARARGYDPDREINRQGFEVFSRAEGEGRHPPSRAVVVSSPRWKGATADASAAILATLRGIMPDKDVASIIVLSPYDSAGAEQHGTAFSADDLAAYLRSIIQQLEARDG